MVPQDQRQIIFQVAIPFADSTGVISCAFLGAIVQATTHTHTHILTCVYIVYTNAVSAYMYNIGTHTCTHIHVLLYALCTCWYLYMWQRCRTLKPKWIHSQISICTRFGQQKCLWFCRPFNIFLAVWQCIVPLLTECFLNIPQPWPSVAKSLQGFQVTDTKTLQKRLCVQQPQ